MKLSIAWIFDHIEARFQDFDITALITQFNQTTAEIESWHKVSYDFSLLSMAECQEHNTNNVRLYSHEWHRAIDLPVRDVIVGQWYLVKKNNNHYSWATSKDLLSAKEHILPAFEFQESFVDGSFKNSLEPDDYIIEIDNKSINHRPDLWGHRGVAREIAAMLKVPLKSIDQLIAPSETYIFNQDEQSSFSITEDMHAQTKLVINNQVPQACKGYAGAVLSVKQKNSFISLTSRLCRIDSKPINACVDFTNYVMFDLGYPMHAFDMDSFATDLNNVDTKKIKTITCRFAQPTGETIELLDGRTIVLTKADLVIAGDNQPIALAGIMGGVATGVTTVTKNIFIESATFDAAIIRRSAGRHKIRTESSARFEKSLDHMHNSITLQRFMKLLIDARMCSPDLNSIFCIKRPHEQFFIEISQRFIEQRIGMPIAPEFIQDTLSTLDFVVQKQEETYFIEVPAHRSSKDIRLKEDIVEEIARFFGYARIAQHLPTFSQEPRDLSNLDRKRSINTLFSFGLSMREVCHHALYDEDFLRQLQFDPQQTLQVLDPVSENWRRLTTSLVPHLIKDVVQNSDQHDSLRFFEWGRAWHVVPEQAEVHVSSVMSNDLIEPFFIHKSIHKKPSFVCTCTLNRNQNSKSARPECFCISKNVSKDTSNLEVSTQFIEGIAQHSIHVNEYKMLSAFVFEKKNPVTFYQGKQLVQQLFDSLKLNVSYEKIDNPSSPWFMPYQTAAIKVGTRVIGTIGVLNTRFTEHLVEGNGVIIELDAHFLCTHKNPPARYKPVPKYPEVIRDVSMLVAYASTTDAITKTLQSVDPHIVDVLLVDFFQKAEWIHERSLTYRMTIQDEHKTLTTQEVDLVMEKVVNALTALGAVIR